MDVASSDDEFSMDPGGERETDEAALRAALHFSVGEICSAETSGKPMSGAAVSTLSEVSVSTRAGAGAAGSSRFRCNAGVATGVLRVLLHGNTEAAATSGSCIARVLREHDASFKF